MNLHTETQNLQWYFAGESLGAKTVTALAAQTILYNLEIEHHALLNAKIINLAGIIVGNGVFNGLTQMLSLINPANGKQKIYFNPRCQLRCSLSVRSADNSSNTL